MITPDKYTNFNQCLLYVSSKILIILKNTRRLSIVKLEYMLNNLDISCESDEYKYSLDLLFCLGLIEFNINNDEIYLVKEVKNV